MIWLYRAITPLAVAWWHQRGSMDTLLEFNTMRNTAVHARRGLDVMKSHGLVATAPAAIAKREIGNTQLSLAQRLGFLEGWYS